MSEKTTHIEDIQLSSAKKGNISISIIEEPYGAGSRSVASIGISLDKKKSEPDWKVHIPKENIDAVIVALQIAKKKL